MGHTKLVRRDYDPETGVTEEFWYEETPGNAKNKIHMRRLQDVEGVLKDNKQEFNLHTAKKAVYGDSKGFHKIATIPLVRIEQWMEEGFDWFNSTDKERRAKLNSRDNQKLLVRPGRL